MLVTYDQAVAEKRGGSRLQIHIQHARPTRAPSSTCHKLPCRQHKVAGHSMATARNSAAASQRGSVTTAQHA